MGKLYLIPNTISDEDGLRSIPGNIIDIVNNIRVFFVEEEKEARRFLRKLNPQFPLQECRFFPLNEHTSAAAIKELFHKEMGESQESGIISEAGCPCVADPGSELVLSAHENNIQVVPLVGPSSIILALMASGLNGQNFAFNGYLPKDKEARLKKIKDLERRSLTENQTQIFMEPPYRNQNLFEDILSCCDAQTLLCVAIDLTGTEELVKTLPIKRWNAMKTEIKKKPALFLIQRKSHAF